MRWIAQVFGGVLLLLLGHGEWLAASQEVLSFANDDCVNGKVVHKNQTSFCECFPGWSGPQCSFCRGRIRYEPHGCHEECTELVPAETHVRKNRLAKDCLVVVYSIMCG